MKNRQRAFIIPLLISIIALVAVGSGTYVYLQKNNKNTQPLNVVVNLNSTSTSKTLASKHAPEITSILPLSGPINTLVTLTGSGFLSTNTVLFGGGPVKNISSSNGGTTLSFTVPGAVGADCQAGMACPMFEKIITPGRYSVVVRNDNGTSNSLTIIVTASN